LFSYNEKKSRITRGDTVSLIVARTDTPRLLRSPPSQEGNYQGQASVIDFLGESPLERGASSVVKMEEAGCVKMRIPGIFASLLTTIPKKIIIVA
jgi:hypothetical protein